MARLLMGLVVGLVLAAGVFAQPVQRTYRIGNSLTWDSQPRSIEKLAAQRQREHVQGYHINCGKSLQRIWTHPKEVCVKVVEPFGTFGEALPEHDWAAVTFQPHPGGNSTLATDAARIVDFIKLTQSKGRNQDTAFYIYAPWPGQQHGAYHEIWTRDTPDADDTKTIQTRAYFDHLLRRVRAKTEATVRLIPAGQVLYELDRRMREGRIDGYADAHDLYRDRVHLNHVGRYAAGVTTYSVLFADDPHGMTCPPGAYGGGKELNPKLYEAIHDAVWHVVNQMNDQTQIKR